MLVLLGLIPALSLGHLSVLATQLRRAVHAVPHGRASPPRACSPDCMPMLPSATTRDVAAEASVAAETARKRSVRSPEDTAGGHARPSVSLLTLVTANSFTMLAAERIDDLTSGKHNGTSWLRPLAMRQSANATLAEAAQRFDPALGWREDFCAVTVFSAATPNVRRAQRSQSSAPCRQRPVGASACAPLSSVVCTSMDAGVHSHRSSEDS